jgi:hypothetical protein
METLGVNCGTNGQRQRQELRPPRTRHSRRRARDHRFTITDADGNADVELNFSLPLTRKRHALLEHLLEEGYTEHEAYVLIAGGEIMAHIESIKARTPKR